MAGCGETTYFAGRQLPPSQLTNRVLVAIQNPGTVTRGALEILDGFYDIRFKYNSPTATFSISGYSGALPITIQNMPEEQIGAVYGSGDGSLALIDYQKETSTGTQSGLNGLSSSIFMTRQAVCLRRQSAEHRPHCGIDRGTSGAYSLSLPGVYRVSVNPGGTVAMAFVQNSNYAYYVKLTTAQTLAYSGGPSTWPKAAVDCEPLNAPGWCLFQMQSPDKVDATGTAYGAPLTFDRPVKAIFSNDGGTAYVLSCGRECGGAHAGISMLPAAAMILSPNQQSGKLPTTAALKTISVPGGASNALIDSTTMYAVGQQLQTDGLFAGRLTVVNLSTNTGWAHRRHQRRRAPGALSRLIQSDDNTLWIGMSKCTNGERFSTGQEYGCLTMFDTADGAVKLIEPFHGDATGIASVTGLHKVYTAEGGQVYIYSTADGHALNNQYVTVTGTAYDVAYMDGLSDANNTVY